MKERFRRLLNFIKKPEVRLVTIVKITTFGLLTGLLITAPAWEGTRSYPLSAILPGFWAPPVVHTGLYSTVILTLLGVVFLKKFRVQYLFLALFCLLLLLLLDVTRLQPWILHYAGILLIGFTVLIRAPSEVTFQKALDAAAILVGGIYFWSGLQKFNAAFYLEVFPWFTHHLSSPFGELGQTGFGTLGFLVPFVEVGLAIGFFTRRFRTISLVASFIMLVLVLSSLGPLGRGWNSAVWPWNLVIFLSAFILFHRSQDSFSSFVLRQRRNGLALVIFLVFWLMPLGNIFGITDHYLSWSLYSGRVPTATLVGGQEFLHSLSTQTTDGELRFEHWTTATLNIVPYPEERVFLQVFASLCQKYPEENLRLRIRTPRFFISTSYQVEVVDCSS